MCTYVVCPICGLVGDQQFSSSFSQNKWARIFEENGLLYKFPLNQSKLSRSITYSYDKSEFLNVEVGEDGYLTILHFNGSEIILKGTSTATFTNYTGKLREIRINFHGVVVADTNIWINLTINNLKGQMISKPNFKCHEGVGRARWLKQCTNASDARTRSILMNLSVERFSARTAVLGSWKKPNLDPIVKLMQFR